MGEHLRKFTQDDYKTIRDLHTRGVTQVRIAAYVGCSQQTVSDVLTGRHSGARKVLKDQPLDAQ
ncbi:MAG: helix-turn-helix transcriptional regulator [Candidatus Dormiibacterota bacterium]